MNLDITGKSIEITPALRQHVENKIRKIKRHFENVIDIHVILDVIKREHHAEATIKISGRTLFAETRSTDMYSAVDQLMDRLDRQIIKAKEKMQHRQHDSIADAIS